MQSPNVKFSISDEGKDGVIKNMLDTTTTSTTETTVIKPSGTEIMRALFKDLPVGVATEDMIIKTFTNAYTKTVKMTSPGVANGRASIVYDNTLKSNVLKLKYPANTVESTNSGAQWKVTFNDKYNELWITYRIKFDDTFDFVKGGKIPGLAGGTAPTNKTIPLGDDGWTARMMWREAGTMIQYIAHVGQAKSTADIFWWKDEFVNKFQFVPGQWHTVATHIKMNDIGASNGLVECFLDGQRGLTIPNITFRTVESLAIDVFLFSSFFGGDSADWMPSKTEYAYFDDFRIFI